MARTDAEIGKVAAPVAGWLTGFFAGWLYDTPLQRKHVYIWHESLRKTSETLCVIFVLCCVGCRWKQASRMKEACDSSNLRLLKDIYEKHCHDQQWLTWAFVMPALHLTKWEIEIMVICVTVTYGFFKNTSTGWTLSPPVPRVAPHNVPSA